MIGACPLVPALGLWGVQCLYMELHILYLSTPWAKSQLCAHLDWTSSGGASDTFLRGGCTTVYMSIELQSLHCPGSGMA